MNVLQRDGRVLHGVVQKTGGQHLGRDAQLSQDLCHGQAVIDVGLAGISFLIAVGFLGHAVRALNQLPVRKRIRVGKPFHQFFERNRRER
jgi:hypothetical protein